LLLVPLALLLVVFFAIPLLWLLRVSFYEHGGASGFGVSTVRFYVPGTFTLANYALFFTDNYFRSILIFTLELAVLVTVVTILLAYPFAYYIYRAQPMMKLVLLIVVILPKLSNMLVLIYGLQILLGNGGLINQVLVAAGIVESPIHLVHNLFSVVLGKVLLIIPYTILVITATLHGLDSTLRDAAQGMGASPVRTFWSVTLPLSLPGTLVALLITLIWALGAFVSPALLGNPDLSTLAVEVPKQTFENVNWAMGAAVAFVMLALVFVVVLAYNHALHASFGWRHAERSR
jgi:ABC-type spermidine/putrescine transport system permease subunit I